MSSGAAPSTATSAGRVPLAAIIARRAEHRRGLAALTEARTQIERADPVHRSPFSPRGLEREDGRAFDPRAPRLGPDEGRDPERCQGPSLGLGL